jgi:hypothetical protein
MEVGDARDNTRYSAGIINGFTGGKDAEPGAYKGVRIDRDRRIAGRVFWASEACFSNLSQAVARESRGRILDCIGNEEGPSHPVTALAIESEVACGKAWEW